MWFFLTVVGPFLLAAWVWRLGAGRRVFLAPALSLALRAVLPIDLGLGIWLWQGSAEDFLPHFAEDAPVAAAAAVGLADPALSMIAVIFVLGVLRRWRRSTRRTPATRGAGAPQS